MQSKLIVVTGGTKGIGKAIIEDFAKMSFDVVTCSRSEADLEALKADIKAINPEVTFLGVQADLSKKSEIKKFNDEVVKLNRPVEVLVNNTGVFVPGAVLTEPEGTLETMINTNLYSAYYVSRALIPLMQEAKRGHVFNMCSIASFMAYPNGGSYSISKFAMLGMSKVLREELKPYGVRVTSVMPGATLTASWEGVEIPEERLMKASDVSEGVVSCYKMSARSVVEELIIRPQLGDL